MTNLELQIQAWHDRKYGKTVNLPATYRKLLEEVGELGEAIIKQDADAIREEAGDVVFVMAHIIRAGCPDHPSISQALFCALEKNEYRLSNQANPADAERRK